MRIGEVVGGVALVGVAVLLVIALTDDGAPETLTADTSPFLFAASTSSAALSTATTTATSPSVESPGSTASTADTTDATTTTAPTTSTLAGTTSTTTVAPTSGSISPDQRAGIAVRVLNGGAPVLAATRMADVLRSAGFAPGSAADATRLVAATRILFAPGRELDAATVNDVVKARPENVAPGAADDPNWRAFGDGLAVLVVLGPAGT
jgi:LytR cell envelope-related transcriptional attenuator